MYKNVILIAFVSCVFVSCVTDMPVDISDNNLPVVNYIMKNDSIQTLNLTRSVKVNDYYIFHEIKDAFISLYKENTLIGNFTKDGYSNWTLKYQPEAGSFYMLKIVTSEGEELTATTTMPELLAISQQSDIDTYPSKNFIQTSAGSPCWTFIITSDRMLFEKSRPNDNDNFKEEIGTNHPLADQFNVQGNLLSFLPTADTPDFLFYIRIKKDSTLNKTNAVSFKLQTNYSIHTFVCFSTCSAEYDNYLKTSFQKILMRLDPSDPLIWFDETKVYSNVSNGVGIFGACSNQFFNYNDNVN